MKVYDFNEKYKEGGQGETFLDRLFESNFSIQEASRNDQRHGIDRWYVDRKTSERFSVEYKTDKTAGRTGNAFVETISVDTQNKPGWAVHSEANRLFYYVPDDRLIYILSMQTIRGQVTEWKRRYPERKIPNRGYNTIGILVPLREFENLSEHVINL